MKYKNPAATVDIIVEQNNKILLVKRKKKPFKGMWALPGGFLEYGKETLEKAAERELEEETNLKITSLKLLNNYSEPSRDPRGHVISHIYIAEAYGIPKARDDAKEVKWFSINALPELAFDHEKIISDYINWRKNGK